ncbi:MAG: Uncharacterised protein [Polaribacter sp. SA4-10]|nr:MAG: Uncharacterised protein [Polaribacter sp. SA4-10]
MSLINQLLSHRNHLEERYRRLLERSDNYRYIDENKSDNAAFKAMKILSKINKVSYLDM